MKKSKTNDAGEINELRRSIIESAFHAGEGHIASALSILDILYVLYDSILNIDPKDLTNPTRDRFFLSKGHASLGLYAVLAQNGFIDKEEMKTFGRFRSVLGGHPDRNKIPGVEASTGSLGHGLPMAIGTALGLKIKNLKSKVFAIIGDGEANEGTIWESALLGSHHKLDNLCVIVDYNHSTDRALDMGDIGRKFESFGWDSINVDGHNHNELKEALAKKHSGKPLVIIAKTVKGRGIKMMEHNPEWHHKSPSVEELNKILNEIA